MAKKKPTPPAARPVDEYRHKQATGPRVPEAGAQPYVKAQPPAARYRYDSSLAPALEWDERNPAREEAEALIAAVLDAPDLAAAKAAAARLKAMSAPFLNWAGKAERPDIDVPTLPLFVHERLSTTGIIETLKGHKRDRSGSLFDFFNDPHLSVAEQAMKAYEHGAWWSNRMILGDNLAVMNWLLRGENLGGQVQMIYLDPPYGIKYGSNFQPFVRKRDVTHDDDDDLTREPEMVQAYRDTWEVGLHSYLTYLRDRLTVARELLHPSGSVFVQISEENLHHVRELMDEVFGADNFCRVITFQKTGGQPSEMTPGLPISCCCTRRTVSH
jgi:adenine-specific DNA-methyltransferase